MTLEEKIAYLIRKAWLGKLYPEKIHWTRVKINRDPTHIANALFQAGLKEKEKYG